MSHLELQEFFVEGSEHKTSHVLLHITEPSTAEEQARGYFFALIEIGNVTIGRIEQFQKMIDDIESGYYGKDQGQKDQFESVLELINRRSEQLLEAEGLVHALVGVIKNNTLILATHGLPDAHLFYRDKQDFAIVDILADNQKEHSREMFPSVLRGTVNAGDFIFVSTPHVSEFFTSDRLQKLITSRSLKQSSEHIQKVLKDMQSPFSFGGIIFRMLPQTEKVPSVLSQKNKPLQGSEASLNKLVHAKQQTAETLYPPLFQHLIRNVKEQIHKVPEHRQKKHPPLLEPTTSEEKTTTAAENPKSIPRTGQDIGNSLLIGLGRAVVTLAVTIGKMVFFLVRGMVRLGIGLFILMTNKNNSRQEVLRSITAWGKNLTGRFGELPFLSKCLFFLTMIAIIILSISLATMNFRKTQAQKQEHYTNILTAVQQKKDAAEASLIYENNETALTLLREARNLLQEIPTEEKQYQNQKQQLEQHIEESLRRMQKIKEVTLESIAKLPDANPGAIAENLVRIDDTLLAFGPKTTVMSRIDLSHKTVQPITHEGMTELRMATTPKEQDTTIFIYGENQLAIYQKDANLLSAKTIGYPATNVVISTAFIYNVKLYTLDAANNQIYKHNKTQTGYDKGTPWLKTSADVSQGVSLAIDGDMFVLTKDGKILKFTAGEPQDFSVSGLEPVLEEPAQIWTYNEVNNIYILEPKHKRVIMLDKTGKLIEQYTSPALINPTGMVVDEANKTVYLLDQQMIFSFALP